jgi:hypothetical protein
MYLTGEGQMSSTKGNLVSPRIWKTGLMLTCVETGDTLFVSFKKFSNKFRCLSSTRSSQSTPTQNNVCQMAQALGVKESVTDWLYGLACDFYDKGIVQLVHCLDKCLNSNRDYVGIWTYVISNSDNRIVWINTISFQVKQNCSYEYFKNDFRT